MPIAIDGMLIHPGDLILGDADGLLSVSMDAAPEVLAACRKKVEAEKKSLEDIAAGTLDQSWVEVTLERIGWNPNAQ